MSKFLESDGDSFKSISRRIKVGGITTKQLLSLLEGAQVQLNDAAKVLFESELFMTSGSPRTLDTVELAVANLGFPIGATISELQERALALGLYLPPLELGPHMRLQYLDQPEEYLGNPPAQHRAPPGSLTVMSAPVSKDRSFPKGFYLRRINGVLWLRGYRCDLEHVFDSIDRLVFCI